MKKMILLVLAMVMVSGICYAAELRVGMTKEEVVEVFGRQPDLKQGAPIKMRPGEPKNLYEQWTWVCQDPIRAFRVNCYFKNGELQNVGGSVSKYGYGSPNCGRIKLKQRNAWF